MSNFAEKRMRREKQEKHDSERRTALSKFLYNLAMACFTIMVLSNDAPLINEDTKEYNTYNAIAIAMGLVSTIVLAYLANNIMRK
nr:MAG TPA: hypothetical protein [Caudoviricetes sp.]